MLSHVIASLRGRVIETGANWLLVEVAGLGYRVIVSPALLSDLRPGTDAFVYTHHHIREDAEDLFGFRFLSDLELFQHLLSISGVGPKVAMTILSIGSADTVRRAIMSGDLSQLTSVPGVGKKTAQKIILELKGQLVDEETSGGIDTDVLDALVGLGYSTAQAKEALKKVTATDAAERVKEALRYLGK